MNVVIIDFSMETHRPFLGNTWLVVIAFLLFYHQSITRAFQRKGIVQNHNVGIVQTGFEIDHVLCFVQTFQNNQNIWKIHPLHSLFCVKSNMKGFFFSNSNRTSVISLDRYLDIFG